MLVRTSIILTESPSAWIWNKYICLAGNGNKNEKQKKKDEQNSKNDENVNENEKNVIDNKKCCWWW